MRPEVRFFATQPFYAAMAEAGFVHALVPREYSTLCNSSITSMRTPTLRSWANRLTAFTRHADGTLSDKRVFAELGGRTPDGICSDAEDGVWVASFETGEMVRVVDGGEVTDIVNFPGKRAVACALGGEDGKALYCATYAGTIDEIHTLKRFGAIEVATVRVPAKNSRR